MLCTERTKLGGERRRKEGRSGRALRVRQKGRGRDSQEERRSERRRREGETELERGRGREKRERGGNRLPRKELKSGVSGAEFQCIFSTAPEPAKGGL